MKNIIVLTTIFLMSSIANAGNVKTTPDTLDILRVGSSGNVVTVYKNDRNTVNPAVCERNYPAQLSQAPGNGVGEKSFDQMFTVLMAAKISNSPVVLYIADDRCSGNYPSIVYVAIE